jgi:hypothetical protein
MNRRANDPSTTQSPQPAARRERHHRRRHQRPGDRVTPPNSAVPAYDLSRRTEFVSGRARLPLERPRLRRRQEGRQPRLVRQMPQNRRYRRRMEVGIQRVTRVHPHVGVHPRQTIVSSACIAASPSAPVATTLSPRSRPNGSSRSSALRGSAASEPRSSDRRRTACSTDLLPPCPIAAPTLRGHHRAGDPRRGGLAGRRVLARRRRRAPSTLIMPAVLLTTPDHGDGVHAADTPGLPAKR